MGIVNALNHLILNHIDCIVLTGGLGPTNDDITRDVLFKYVKTKPELTTDQGKRELTHFVNKPR